MIYDFIPISFLGIKLKNNIFGKVYKDVTLSNNKNNMSTASAAFETFLNAHKHDKTSSHSHTHTRIPKADMGIFGGSYYIPDEDLDEFYKLYAEKMKTGRMEYLIEKQRDDNRVICIDLDFKYDPSIDTRQHTRRDIIEIVEAYWRALCQVLDIHLADDLPLTNFIPVYVMEKPNVNTDDEKYTKDGIHIIFCMAAHPYIPTMIHDMVLPILSKKLAHLPIKNSWEDAMDENVTRFKNPVGWTLYGSRKPAHDAYVITHMFELTESSFATADRKVYTFDPFENIELLSVRNRKVPIFEVKDKDELYEILHLKTRHPSPSRASSAVVITHADDYKQFIDLNCEPATADNQRTWFWNAVALMRHFEGETAIKAVHYYSSTAPNYDYEGNKHKVDEWLNKYDDDKFAPTIRFKRPKPQRGICHIKLEEDVVVVEEEIIALSEEEVAKKAYEKLKDTFMSINQQLYGKWGNIWCCNNIAQWDALLCNAIVALKIKHRVIKQHKFGEFQTDIVWCDTISHLHAVHKRVKQMIISNPCDNMYDLFHSSTLGKLCFEDGVYDFRTHKFWKWESDELKKNPVYSCVKIPRNFPSYEDEVNDWADDLQKARLVFHAAMGEEQAEKFLAYLARATAGEIKDKVFSCCVFNRDCSKGVINDWFIAAFGNYIGQADSNALVIREMLGDSEKENGWLIPLQYCRHVFISELEVDQKNSKKKLNSKMIKSICSGGDPMKGRLMRENGISFRLQCALDIMVNDLIPFSSVDVLEKCLMLTSVTQFKSQAYINAEKEKCKDSPILLKSLENLKLADPTIRDKVKTNEWADALVRIMIHYYTDKAAVLNNKEANDDDDDSLNVKVVGRFEFTGDKEHKVTNETLRAFAHLNNVSLSKLKTTIMGIDNRVENYRTNREKGLKCLKEIPPSAVEEE